MRQPQRIKGTSPSRGCGEVPMSGIKSAAMKSVVFINTPRVESHDHCHRRDRSRQEYFCCSRRSVDENGKTARVKPKIARDQLLPLIANLPPCLIGMEACSGAHHWAQLFRQPGHSGPQVRNPVPHGRQARQKRCSGRRRHLRSRHPASDAILTDALHVLM